MKCAEIVIQSETKYLQLSCLKIFKPNEYISTSGLCFGHTNGGVIAPPLPPPQNEVTGWAISKLDKQFHFTQPCFILSRSSGIRKTSVGMFIVLLQGNRDSLCCYFFLEVKTKAQKENGGYSQSVLIGERKLN